MIHRFEPPYAVEAIGYEKKSGETPVYRHFMYSEKLLSHPPNIYTMWEMYLHGYNTSIDRPFLGTRRKENNVYKEYQWETHREIKPCIENFGKGLSRLGLNRQEALGVYSINRREWTMTEIACYRESFIIVALYDTLGPEAMEYIINQTDMEMVVASQDKIKHILAIKDKLPSIKCIISMDKEVDASLLDTATSLNVSIHTFKQVEELGARVQEDSDLPAVDDIATICYTSGTTGVPKGAVITHANCVASVYSVAHLCDTGSFTSVSETDIYVSYLPMAHVFERVAQAFVLYKGSAIGFYHGDTAAGLLDDMAELKPTVFCSVPRLFNRIYDKVFAGVRAKGGRLASYLFHMAYESKRANLHQSVNHWFYDRFIFKPIREKLGGRLRFILSGSAPVAPEVLEFLKICFSSWVHEGYGQTENYCGGALTILGDNTPGVVGAPFPCSEIKLVDVPDMNYLTTDLPYPRGEICIRGNSIMREFYKSPEKTAEAIDSEGWLHTGDIGMLDDAKRISIIDRLKNIFKLSQGEYIAPEKIESVYQKHAWIAQAFVYGDSKQSQLVGIFVPDKETFKPWVMKQPGLVSAEKELYVSAKVKEAFLKEIESFGKKSGLKGFEQVKAVCLCEEEFSVENELLTPTFKVKREAVRNLYMDQINAMYNALTNGRSFN